MYHQSLYHTYVPLGTMSHLCIIRHYITLMYHQTLYHTYVPLGTMSHLCMIDLKQRRSVK